jgi:hypothetical protein
MLSKRSGACALAVAIAQCITGYFAYECDQTFDQVNQNQNRLYRVISLLEFDTSVTRYGYHESGGIVEG